MRKKRYAVCGLSNRAIAHFALPLIGNKDLPEYGDWSEYGEIVGILDLDKERVEAFNRNQRTNFPYFAPNEFDKMVDETRPDTIFVVSTDVTHAEYITQGLNRGIDIVSEKPMVIDSKQGREVVEAARKSSATLRVAFNYRYTPAHKQIKRMIMDGLIGDITSVEFNYMLDTYHGSSYFRRWNRDRSLSGGLTITKACHHFDLLNWWLDDIPEKVFAFGKRNYFGANSPYNPNPPSGEPLPVEEQKKRCPYWKRWNIPGGAPPKDDHLVAHKSAFDLPMKAQYPKELYFYDKEISIEDTYSAAIRYSSGASVAYSLIASSPWEGYTLAINGIKGRLETKHITALARCPFPADDRQTIAYMPMFGERQIWETRHVEGGHGGADNVIKNDIFVAPSEESLELGIQAGAEDGAYAVAIGEAVWRSALTEKPVEIPRF